MKRVNAHPDNVPGDFYVEDGCCTLCGIPQVHAPELFSDLYDKADHCYVKKQPTNETELGQMLRVIQGAELRCVRYCGGNSEIRAKLAATGDGDICDNQPDDQG
ncbi:MAG: hypothetical protein O3A53_12520 [Acidobacteria bacterium]|nr:hypothetical protein [Acidobacteriota bacterium]MDA1235617.1 hypothetical protein [Acidobacteriota bacterium]